MLKTLTALAAIVVILAALWIVSQKPTSNAVQISLSSEPFPLSVGSSTLLVSLKRADGAPIDNAAVEVSGQMQHQGMLPLTGRTSSSANGEYRVPIIWPMMGQWMVDVTARLPDGGQAADQYEVVVYAVPPHYNGSRTTYRSVSESTSLVTDPSRELLIVIPEGTQAMITAGLIDDVIPAAIHLSVNGQNTLVIQNNDLVDHRIGPFFIRPGEVIRQRFTSTAVYRGVCTIRQSAVVNIIVEN